MYYWIRSWVEIGEILTIIVRVMRPNLGIFTHIMGVKKEILALSRKMRMRLVLR